MKVVRISASKNNWHFITSNGSDPSIKSYASLLLLQNELRNSDQDDVKNYWKTRILFSRTFLHKILDKEKDLVCTYCGKRHLVIEEENMFVKNHLKATIDHVLPISKGGSVYDTDNVVVACGTCNSRKDNMTLGKFLDKFKTIKPNMKILQPFLDKENRKINTLATLNPVQ